MAHHLETRQTDPPIRPSLACARVSAHLSAARRRAVSSFAFDRVRQALLVDPLLVFALQFSTLVFSVALALCGTESAAHGDSNLPDGGPRRAEPTASLTCRACSRVTRQPAGRAAE